MTSKPFIMLARDEYLLPILIETGLVASLFTFEAKSRARRSTIRPSTDAADAIADIYGDDTGMPLSAHGIVGGAAGSMLAGKAADKFSDVAENLKKDSDDTEE